MGWADDKDLAVALVASSPDSKVEANYDEGMTGFGE